MVLIRGNPLALLLWFICAGHSPAQEVPDTVCYQHVNYYSVDNLAGHMRGTASLSPQARSVLLTVKDQQWEFVDGGLRLKLTDGTEQALKQPLLVLQGKHYFPLEECAPAFGYRVEPGDKNKKRLLLTIGGKEHVIEPSPIDSPYHRHKAEKLEAVHEFVVVETPLRGLRTTHRKEDVRDIPTETRLLVRRKVVLDAVAHVVVNDCGPSLDSFLIAEEELRKKTKPVGGDGTAWNKYRPRFHEQAQAEAALRRGEPKRLDKTVAVTVDLCWSLRRSESGLLQTLKEVAARSKKKIHPVMFVSGRWLDQHPLEMHELIELSREPNVEMIWGHHSWDHPKTGGFMNDYSPAQLRKDTLRLEQAFLEWGITPTVYYRFPGLIHDRVRLAEILDLDLFPIDCDCWMALVRKMDKDPFYHHAREGSIILVHGNGNEPAGIPPLQRWFEEHQDWELGHLNQFFAPAE
jgi:peptidoglycan/xylan/chitin deacetylase (PgdA/CDA1 family)